MQLRDLTGSRRWLRRPPKGWAAPLAVLVGCGVLACHLLSFPELPDLSHEGETAAGVLKQQWAEGKVIAVVRHLERCDRVEAACLEGDPGGITARSVAVGEALAERFRQLDLGGADIFHSPLSRTAQTARVLFGEASTPQQWLYDCRRSGTLLADALKHKRTGHNLVLVTHSTCKDKFENDLGFDSDTPEYGTVWFTSYAAGEERPLVLGFLDADDWGLMFPGGRGRQALGSSR